VLEPLQTIRAGVLDVAYYEAGPAGGAPVVLLHGFPHDIHAYAEVAGRLAHAGLRVIVPYLRGYGATRFVDARTPRSGQQAALGADLRELIDALALDRPILAGYDWGGRAACIVAALWPERCRGLVTANPGYSIQDIAIAEEPARPELEAGLWYFFYFATERGRRGLQANRAEIARLIWERASPEWVFDDATFARTAPAFENDDYVEIVIHSYRHRLGLAPGDPAYDAIERELAALPPISVPAITLDPLADANFPAGDGTAVARHFTGPRAHRHVANAGHNLPQEQPAAFAEAVLELAAT
jgi:pimeloyl-ACP methyl ester carboxylesterase